MDRDGWWKRNSLRGIRANYLRGVYSVRGVFLVLNISAVEPGRPHSKSEGPQCSLDFPRSTQVPVSVQAACAPALQPRW